MTHSKFKKLFTSFVFIASIGTIIAYFLTSFPLLSLIISLVMAGATGVELGHLIKTEYEDEQAKIREVFNNGKEKVKNHLKEIKIGEESISEDFELRQSEQLSYYSNKISYQEGRE